MQISDDKTYQVPAQRNYRNSEYCKLEFQFSDSPDIGISKKIHPESLELNTELEFHLRWGSQKSEPKIEIPNQGVHRTNDILSQSAWSVVSCGKVPIFQVQELQHCLHEF